MGVAYRIALADCKYFKNDMRIQLDYKLLWTGQMVIHVYTMNNMCIYVQCKRTGHLFPSREVRPSDNMRLAFIIEKSTTGLTIYNHLPFQLCLKLRSYEAFTTQRTMLSELCTPIICTRTCICVHTVADTPPVFIRPAFIMFQALRPGVKMRTSGYTRLAVIQDNMVCKIIIMST